MHETCTFLPVPVLPVLVGFPAAVVGTGRPRADDDADVVVRAPGSDDDVGVVVGRRLVLMMVWVCLPKPKPKP